MQLYTSSRRLSFNIKIHIIELGLIRLALPYGFMWLGIYLECIAVKDCNLRLNPAHTNDTMLILL